MPYNLLKKLLSAVLSSCFGFWGRKFRFVLKSPAKNYIETDREVSSGLLSIFVLFLGVLALLLAFAFAFERFGLWRILVATPSVVDAGPPTRCDEGVCI